MHVLCFTHLFPNSREHLRGSFILDRYRYLRQHVDCTVVAPLPYAPPLPLNERWWRLSRIPYRERIDGIDVYHPRYLKFPGLGFARQHRAMTRGARCSVHAIHAHNPVDIIEAPWLFPDALAALAVSRELGVPLVATALGSDINEYLEDKALLGHILRVMREADKVACVSRALATQGVQLGIPATRFRVIYNGVDSDLFDIRERSDCRAKLGLPRDERIVLYVGHMEMIKGMYTLVDCWCLFDSVQDPPLLIMLGNGPMKDTIRKALGSRKVLFVPEQPHEKIADWMNAADVLVLPSDNEGIPNVILEANACGVPVVSTNVGGVSEIVSQDGCNGLLVPPRSPKALFDAINEAMIRSWDRNLIRAAAVRFTWEDGAIAFASLFRQLVEPD